MTMELDHLFVCADPGAPEADILVELGLHEGPPNNHPGQGTANRRFAFVNAMIEFLWVSDSGEARNQDTERTQLWERWSGRSDCASPFGICARPAGSQNASSPFHSWKYWPAYLPDPFAMHVGEAGIEEPMWVYLDFMRRAHREQWFVEHAIGLREITGLTLTTPVPLQSDAAQRFMGSGILELVA